MTSVPIKGNKVNRKFDIRWPSLCHGNINNKITIMPNLSQVARICV